MSESYGLALASSPEMRACTVKRSEIAGIDIRTFGGDDIVLADDLTIPITVSGGEGDDEVIGGSGGDTLSGDGDDDMLHGGDGDDTLVGGPGNDCLDGGPGANQLSDEDGGACRLEQLPLINVTAFPSVAYEQLPMHPGVFLIQLSEVAETPILVQYKISGTATNGWDYQWLSGMVWIPAGARSTSVCVHPFKDNLIEGIETVKLTLQGYDWGYQVGESPSATVAIGDSESLPVVGIVATAPIAFEPSTPEPSVDGIPGEFTVTRTSGDLDWQLIVDYIIVTQRRPAAVHWEDYLLRDSRQDVLYGALTFDKYATQATIEVDPLGDRWIEGVEYVQVRLIPNTLGAPTYVIATGLEQAQVTIYDIVPQELPEVTITATNQYAAESDPLDPSQPMDVGTFTISRPEGNTAGDLEVFYRVLSSSDRADASLTDDFATVQSRSASVTIPAGRSSVDVTVVPKDDSEKEWDEVLEWQLLPGDPNDDQHVEYVVRQDNSAQIFILDNDGIDGLVDRNVDTESTGSASEIISNDVVDVSLQQGTVDLALPLFPAGFGPTYRGDDNLHPIVSVDWHLPGTTVPTSIDATLFFTRDSRAEQVSYSTSSVPSTSEALRFVLMGPDDLAQELQTGHYDYDIEFVAHLPGGATRTRTVRGGTEIINRVNPTLGTPEFGQRWSVSGLDRLVPADGTTARNTDRGLAARNGMALIRGDNTSA